MTKASSRPLGEHRIIEIIQNNLTIMPQISVGFGDDVSAIKIGEKHVAVLKTDMLVAKTDVPKQMSLKQAARKAVIMNISDFASKGVQPTAVLVALGLPKGFTEKDVQAIAEGLDTGAQEYGAYVVGGDTSETQDLIISIMLYGISEKPKLMLRTGAQPGDILAVTGFFGNQSAGLKLLLKDCIAPEELRKKLLDSVFMPKARLAEGLKLSESGAASASMDSSDGLAWSLHELARLSNVGFLLESIPVASETVEFAKINNLDSSELALYGGEEYELVLTIKPGKWESAQTAVKKAGGQLIRIGKATKEKKVLININGKKQQVQSRGWEHFKSQL
jgi:thiamine-monophosphate kinase